MKYFSLIIIIFSFFITSSYANTLAELKALSPNPLYFTLQVEQYVITPLEFNPDGDRMLAMLEIIFKQPTATVITDRPIRQVDELKVDDVISYVTSPAQKSLVFTLTTQEGQDSDLVNFTVETSFYDAKSKSLLVKAHVNSRDKTLHQQFTQQGQVSGQRTTLLVEG